jgi:hypothetical protein
MFPMFADFNPGPMYLVFYGGWAIAGLFLTAAVVWLGLRLARRSGRTQVKP